MTDSNNYSLATDLARLEERINTKQAEYRTETAQLPQKLAEIDAHASERDARAASERTAHTRWLIGAIAIATLVTIGSLNILLQ